MVRAWYAAKADRATWDEERYPQPPEMSLPDPVLFEGSWADIQPSYIRQDRPSHVRGKMIETSGKRKHLRKRREARRYRVYQREAEQ